MAKTTLNIDDALWRWLRVWCLQNGKSATEVIEELIRQFQEAQQAQRDQPGK